MLILCGRKPGLVFLFMVLMPWTNAVVAAQRAPLTIAEAEDIALAGEPRQLALLAQGDALEDEAIAAGQLPDPTLRLGLANYPVSSGDFSTEGMTQLQVGLRQQLPRGRTRELRTARLQWMAAQMDASAAARAREVLTRTRANWLEAYYWQRAQKIITESRPFFSDLVSVTRSMYAVGRKTQQDVLRAELELSRLDDRLIEADRAHAQAQAQLSQWLGEDAYRPIAMKLPSWTNLPSVADLLRELDSHPAMDAAAASISEKDSGVNLANESYKPGWAVDLGYGYREGSLPTGEPRSDFISLSVTVDLPLFGENRQDRKLAAALSERRAAIASKDALFAELQSSLRVQYARWHDLNRRLTLYETRILEQSDGQAQAALLAYQSDAGDFSDVMHGYIDNLNTRLDYTRLQVDRAQSYAMLANLGGISQ